MERKTITAKEKTGESVAGCCSGLRCGRCGLPFARPRDWDFAVPASGNRVVRLEAGASDSVHPAADLVQHVSGKRSLFGTYYLNPPKGYPRLNHATNSSTQSYVHRAVWKFVASHGPLKLVLPNDWHIHHQDRDKLNFQPTNLIAMPPVFNPSNFLRHPWTGKYLTPGEYRKVVGVVVVDEVPF